MLRIQYPPAAATHKEVDCSDKQAAVHWRQAVTPQNPDCIFPMALTSLTKSKYVAKSTAAEAGHAALNSAGRAKAGCRGNFAGSLWGAAVHAQIEHSLLICCGSARARRASGLLSLLSPFGHPGNLQEREYRNAPSRCFRLGNNAQR
jgi:hypothetical protein